MASSPLPGGSRHVGRVVDPSVRDDGEPDPAVELEIEHCVTTSASDERAVPSMPDGMVSGGEQLELSLGATEEARSELAEGATGNASDESVTLSTPTSSPNESSSPPAPPTPEATRPLNFALEPAERAALLSGGRARDVLLERARAAREAARVDPSAALGDLDEIGKPEGATIREPNVRSRLPRPPSAPFVGNPKGRLSPVWIAVFGTLLGVATVASLVALGMNLDVKSQPSPASNASAASAASSQEAAPAPAAPVAKPKRSRTKVPGPWRIADAKGDAALKIAEDRVGTDPFLKALERAGVKTAQTYRILTAMKGVRDFNRCKASDRFVVLIERGTSKVKAFEYIESPEEVYQAREGADGLLKGAKLELKVERNQVTGSLAYDGKSFDASAEQGGFDRGLAKAVAKALDGHMGLDEIDRGSLVRVIAQEVTVLGEFARYSGIEALEIRPPDSSKPFRLYYFAAGAERGYFDAEGRSPYEGGWRKPIPDAAMTSPYNLKRMHPILRKVMPHLGIDFGASIGTPVGAANYGTVTFASYLGPTGNLVKIAHPGGIETGYAHLSRFADGLKVGDKVKRQQVIGYVGSTGRSTGPHLHFSARKNGDFIDPASLNLDSMRVLSKENRDAFAEVKAKYDAALEAITLPAPLAPLITAPASSANQMNAGDAPGAASAGSAQAQAPVPPSSDPAQGEEDDETSAGTTPAGVAPKPAGKAGSAVYLTDKELLKLQGATDEGEVAE